MVTAAFCILLIASDGKMCLESSMKLFNLLSHNFVFNADDDVPSKVAKLDVPSTQLVGGMVPQPLGAAYPPRPSLPTMPQVYVIILLFIFCFYFACGESGHSYIFLLI